MIIPKEGEENYLERIHDEYLQNMLGINWTKMEVLIYTDTWNSDPTKQLLIQQRLDDVGREKNKEGGNNIMLDQGLEYFMPYESFAYPYLPTTIALRTNA